MAQLWTDMTFTRSAKAQQERLGSRKNDQRGSERGGFHGEITPELAEFIEQRTSAYLGTANSSGQPYIQHRGGPTGFLKVLGERTLGFADFSGNRQYISLGNLSENDRAQLFLMDYANRRRIKIWGRARVVEDDPALLERLIDPGYKARPERAFIFEVEAWDVNCPQHITPRYTEAEIAPAIERLQQRIAELEAGLADQP